MAKWKKSILLSTAILVGSMMMATGCGLSASGTSGSSSGNSSSVVGCLEHIYDNACDTECNSCGQERTPSEHVYDNEYDTTCNVCGEERDVSNDSANGGNWTGEAPLT